MYVRWHGGDLDRLLDEAHAGLVERVAQLLRRLGWQVLVEVSYNRWGERGSVDILAWHAAARTVLVVEVKSEITAVEETLRKHDTKVRLAPAILHERLGERPAALLACSSCPTHQPRVVASSSTTQRSPPPTRRAGGPSPAGCGTRRARWQACSSFREIRGTYRAPAPDQRKGRMTSARRATPRSIADSAIAP